MSKVLNLSFDISGNAWINNKPKNPYKKSLFPNGITLDGVRLIAGESSFYVHDSYPKNGNVVIGGVPATINTCSALSSGQVWLVNFDNGHSIAGIAIHKIDKSILDKNEQQNAEQLFKMHCPLPKFKSMQGKRLSALYSYDTSGDVTRIRREVSGGYPGLNNPVHYLPYPAAHYGCFSGPVKSIDMPNRIWMAEKIEQFIQDGIWKEKVMSWLLNPGNSI